MKKIYTIATVLALAAMTQANAANRSWNFTKWSAETVENLKTGSDWSDIEKADADAPTELSKENCFWQVNATEDLNADKYLMANDVVIAELEGLVYTNTTNRSLAIAVNYPTTSLGDYNGASYLWLGGSKKDYFLIPQVAPGSVIKMGVESHKPAEARGVELYIGAGHEGTKLVGVDGEAVATPKTYEDQAWQVPADLEGPTDIQIYNTNGCHIYYITVEETGEIAPAPEVKYYAVGGFQNWDPANPTEFTYADGVYTLEVNAGQMKISTACGDWDTFNAATIGPDGTANEEGVVAFKAWADYQFNLDYEANWTITIDDVNKTIKFSTSDPKPAQQDIWLRGDMNGWGTDDAWKFTSTDGNVYTLSNVSIEAGKEFKVADASWGTINYGASATAKFAPNTLVTLSQGGANCSLTESVENATVTFNLADKTLIVSTGTGVNLLESADAAVYYNLQGVRVDNPQNGLYIERRGNVTKKVVIKK